MGLKRMLERLFGMTTHEDPPAPRSVLGLRLSDYDDERAALRAELDELDRSIERLDELKRHRSGA